MDFQSIVVDFLSFVERWDVGMDSLVEQLIVDFHARPLPTPIRRAAELPILSGKIDRSRGAPR